MKRRYRYMLNVLSMGLLFFALYLNFFKKDIEDVSIKNDKETETRSSEKQGPKAFTKQITTEKFALK